MTHYWTNYELFVKLKVGSNSIWAAFYSLAAQNGRSFRLFNLFIRCNWRKIFRQNLWLHWRRQGRVLKQILTEGLPPCSQVSENFGTATKTLKRPILTVQSLPVATMTSQRDSSSSRQLSWRLTWTLPPCARRSLAQFWPFTSTTTTKCTRLLTQWPKTHVSYFL